MTIARKDYAYLLRLAQEATRAAADGASVKNEARAKEAAPATGDSLSQQVRHAVVARRRLRHDVRGLLNSLRLTAECLRRDLYSLAEAAESLDAIAADLERVTGS